MALRINPRLPQLAAAVLLALWLAACAGGPSHPLAQHDAFRQGELANRQARAALARGELSSARQLTEQARQHYQRLDARERVIDCELQLATLALRQNDLAGVRAVLARLADWQLTPEQQRALAERHQGRRELRHPDDGLRTTTSLAIIFASKGGVAWAIC